MTVVTGHGPFVTLVVHVVTQVPLLESRPTLVFTPHDLPRTVPLVCLIGEEEKKENMIYKLNMVFISPYETKLAICFVDVVCR